MEFGLDSSTAFSLLLALAALPAAAALGAVDEWDLPGKLRRLYDASFELPLARFLPPIIQVLVPVWLGTPGSTQARVALTVHLARPVDGWPLEAPILLLALVLAVLYGGTPEKAKSIPAQLVSGMRRR